MPGTKDLQACVRHTDAYPALERPSVCSRRSYLLCEYINNFCIFIKDNKILFNCCTLFSPRHIAGESYVLHLPIRSIEAKAFLIPGFR
jgi:hypothetical protein